jgi:hypothetical protein
MLVKHQVTDVNEVNAISYRRTEKIATPATKRNLVKECGLTSYIIQGVFFIVRLLAVGLTALLLYSCTAEPCLVPRYKELCIKT